jgi:cold shock CspA family protein
MKKLFIALTLLIFSLSVYSQNEISYGVSLLYQEKKVNSDWSGWKEASSPILLYMDLGFGFIAVENGYKDRFIIKEIDGKFSNENSDVTRIRCVDKEKKNCTVEIVKFHNGNSALVIKYADIQYSYLVLEGDGYVGYPFQYFNKEDNNSKKLNEKIL